MKRAPLKRKTWLRRRSPKRDAYERDLDAMRSVIDERSGGRCEYRTMVAVDDYAGWERCPNHVDHLHHRQRRSQGGRNTEANIVALCTGHHDWIHAHPFVSKRLGWLVSAGQNPSKVPIPTGPEREAS